MSGKKLQYPFGIFIKLYSENLL